MSDVVCPGKIAAALTEHWSPRVVAELDDSYVKVAKVQVPRGIVTYTMLRTGG